MQREVAFAGFIGGFKTYRSEGIVFFRCRHAKIVQADKSFHVFNVVPLEISLQVTLEHCSGILGC